MLLAEERSAFLPLPAQEWEARRITQAHANSLSLVRFDTNSSSVPVKYAPVGGRATGGRERRRCERFVVAAFGTALATGRFVSWARTEGVPACACV